MRYLSSWIKSNRRWVSRLHFDSFQILSIEIAYLLICLFVCILVLLKDEYYLKTYICKLYLLPTVKGTKWKRTKYIIYIHIRIPLFPISDHSNKRRYISLKLTGFVKDVLQRSSKYIFPNFWIYLSIRLQSYLQFFFIATANNEYIYEDNFWK